MRSWGGHHSWIGLVRKRATLKLQLLRESEETVPVWIFFSPFWHFPRRYLAVDGFPARCGLPISQETTTVAIKVAEHFTDHILHEAFARCQIRQINSPIPLVSVHRRGGGAQRGPGDPQRGPTENAIRSPLKKHVAAENWFWRPYFRCGVNKIEITGVNVFVGARLGVM